MNEEKKAGFINLYAAIIGLLAAIIGLAAVIAPSCSDNGSRINPTITVVDQRGKRYAFTFTVQTVAGKSYISISNDCGETLKGKDDFYLSRDHRRVEIPRRDDCGVWIKGEIQLVEKGSSFFFRANDVTAFTSDGSEKIVKRQLLGELVGQ